MKTNLKGYGIIAAIVIIGFAFFASISLAGCDNGNDPGSGNGNNPGSGNQGSGGENKESAITLTLNQWKNGNIAANGEQWFKFTATASPQYVHFDPGTLVTVYVQVYDSTGAAIGGQTYLSSGTLRTSQTVTSGSVYYIKVKPPSNSGAYKIAFNASSTPPPSITLPTEGVTALTANTWSDGTIAADGEQWFKFTATASPQYVHFQTGTLDNVYVRVYDNTGVLIGITNLGSSTPSMRTTVTPDSEYYIRVMPYSGSGAYKIAFNASSTSPPITLPAEGVIQLTLNTWADGTIAANGKQWFKFTATASPQYVHFDPGTLRDVYVQVYDSTGAPIEDRTNLYSSTLRTSRTVTPDSEYYIKVTPSYGSGAYKITFNASTTPPPSITLPTAGVTPLTANIWANSTIAANGEQWFKFTATATTQYIHFQTGTLNDVYVQVYDSTGVAIEGRSRLYGSGSNLYRNWAVTPNSEYYIRVTPYGSDGSGAYKILFNASSTPPITLPTSNVTQLTLDIWANGTIAANGEKWFKFTATAATHYIHFQEGTLKDVYVQVYDSTGAPIGDRTNLYSSKLYTSLTVTPSSVYYIKVTPYSSSGSGEYMIAFNTSSTKPQRITLPTSGVTQLTINTVANGNITTAGGEQWFKFTVNPSGNYYINFTAGTLLNVYVQMYDSTGVAIGDRKLLNGSTTSTSPVGYDVGSVYYIKVTPSSGSGTYSIRVSKI